MTAKCRQEGAANVTRLERINIYYVARQISSKLTFANHPPLRQSQEYDAGDYGRYPTETFISSNVRAPRTNIIRQNSACADDLLTFLAPRGLAHPANHPQATILDNDGSLVWASGWEKKQIHNFMVQKYKGASYLTFWAGHDAIGGHGAGDYYMLDQSYNLTQKVSAANDLKGDMHEFRLTPEGTALLTVYTAVSHDLTPLGKQMGRIWDCIFQEINIETGHLIFEWRASQHINVTDTYRNISSEGGPDGDPFDWFHINSIDKDQKGNYLVSSRYFHCLFYIESTTGKVLWTLGGKDNKFSDLSGGKATDFKFQHHALWTKDYSEIILFDNSDDGKPPELSKPRGMRINVDQVAMTARLVQEYRNPHHLAAPSQGSAQSLPNGNVLLSYGLTPVFTEFSHDGRLLCDSHYGPKSGMGTGHVHSYRVLKFEWHGYPTTDPDLAIVQDDSQLWRAYVSWNGATDVIQWRLQGTDRIEIRNEGDWATFQVKAKQGFETNFLLEAGHPKYLRAAALDAKGQIMGISKRKDASNARTTHAVNHISQPMLSFRPPQPITRGLTMGIGAVALVVLIISVWKGYRWFRFEHVLTNYTKTYHKI